MVRGRGGHVAATAPLTPLGARGSDLIRSMPRGVAAAVKGGDIPAGQGALVSNTVGEVSLCDARDRRHRRALLGKKEVMIPSPDRQSCKGADILAVETSAKESELCTNRNGSSSSVCLWA